MSIIKPITSKVMSLADYEYIYPVIDTMQGRARAPPHRPTLHSQTVPYRPGIEETLADMWRTKSRVLLAAYASNGSNEYKLPRSN